MDAGESKGTECQLIQMVARNDGPQVTRKIRNAAE